MKTSIHFYIILFCTLFTIYSCQSLIEKDISKDMVILLSPPNETHSDVYKQTLWWSKIDGATAYNLQIVNPSFEEIERLILDTNVAMNQFVYTFTPDSFAWRVKAFNPAYETMYSEAIFVIDSTEKPQTVNLISPVDNYSTNDAFITFVWSSADNAIRYNILIYKNDVLLYDLRINNNTSVKFPDLEEELPQITDGIYYWQVRSESVLASSDYSAQRKLEVDLIAPETPVIITPAINDTVSVFKISWKHNDNSGSNIKDSLIIYSDSIGGKEYYSQYTSDTIFERNSTSDGWYQYKVKSVDKAGNMSNWSAIRRFYFKNEQ